MGSRTVHASIDASPYLARPVRRVRIHDPWPYNPRHGWRESLSHFQEVAHKDFRYRRRYLVAYAVKWWRRHGHGIPRQHGTG